MQMEMEKGQNLVNHVLEGLINQANSNEPVGTLALLRELAIQFVTFTDEEKKEIEKLLLGKVNTLNLSDENKPKTITRGYKVFNDDWTCGSGHKIYEIGVTYTSDRNLKDIDFYGNSEEFYFYKEAKGIINDGYYCSRARVAEVVSTGFCVLNDKCYGNTQEYITDELTIVRELSKEEVYSLCNIGKNNKGHSNVGDSNVGNFNIGYRNNGFDNTGESNIGRNNSGHFNVGDYNVGGVNVGDGNTGRHNKGDYNVGSLNEGSYNTGYCNSGDHNTGCFSTITPKMRLFEKETDLTYEEVMALPGMRILRDSFKLTEWVMFEDMSAKEKRANKQSERQNGYLKCYTYHEAWLRMWMKLNGQDKDAILSLPNFDRDIFKEITGIAIEPDDIDTEEDDEYDE